MLVCDYLLDCGIIVSIPYSKSVPPLVASMLQGVIYEGACCLFAGLKPRTITLEINGASYELILPRVDLLDVISQIGTVTELVGEKYDKVFLNSLMGVGT